MAFTEFYINSLGSNLNAGSSPNATAFFTSTSGNFQGLGISNFRPTDGQNPFGNVGTNAYTNYASIYVDGATTAVYIVRINSVQNAANGNISVSVGNSYGTAPTNSATARSIKVGGAWLGPAGAVTFPFGLAGTIG